MIRFLRTLCHEPNPFTLKLLKKQGVFICAENEHPLYGFGTKNLAIPRN